MRVDIHVAPWGHDSSPGTEEPPFAILERAQQAVPASTSGMDGDIMVNLHPSTHDLSEPLALTAAAGDSGQNGHRDHRGRWGDGPEGFREKIDFEPPGLSGLRTKIRNIRFDI